MQIIEYTIDHTLQRLRVGSLCWIVGKNRNLGSLCSRSKNLQIAQEVKFTIGMWCAHHKISLIFKGPIKFPMHCIKHEFFMGHHKTASEEG